MMLVAMALHRIQLCLLALGLFIHSRFDLTSASGVLVADGEIPCPTAKVGDCSKWSSQIGFGEIQSSCIGSRHYDVPSVSVPGEYFRTAVLSEDPPFNGSVRRLLQDWYYHGNLTSNAVVGASAKYATVPVIIAAMVLVLALLFPIFGATVYWHVRQKADAICMRSPWSRYSCLALTGVVVLAVGTATFAIITILASMDSRTALNSIRPTVKADLKQLDRYVSNTVSTMQGTLVDRGRCLADYVDSTVANKSDTLPSPQSLMGERLHFNLTSQQRRVLDATTELRLVNAQLYEMAAGLKQIARSNDAELNASQACTDLNDTALNTTDGISNSILCSEVPLRQNLSSQLDDFITLIESVAITHNATETCLQNEFDSSWTELVGDAVHPANSSETVNSTSGQDWLQFVKASMERAVMETAQFVNSTLGLPVTYSSIDDVMTRHVERYEDYRHVLSMILLVLVVIVTVGVLVLIIYGFVLLRCEDCGRASVPLTERLTLIGRVLERMVTGSYLLLALLLWTAGWFYLAASLLGSSCGDQRNMVNILSNVVDNPHIWNDIYPLSRLVYGSELGGQYPLLAAQVHSECSDARPRSLWTALRIGTRQPLAELTGREVNFDVPPSPNALAMSSVAHRLKTAHHRCLNRDTLHALQRQYRQLGNDVQYLDQSTVPGLSGISVNAFDFLEQSEVALHDQRHSLHLLINETGNMAALYRSAQASSAQQQVASFSQCTGDQVKRLSPCGVLPCLYQSTARSMCGDYLSALDAYWFFAFCSAVALWFVLLFTTCITRKYFIESQPLIEDFSTSKAIAGQLMASVLFGAAWILDLMVSIEFYRERDSDGMASASMWMVAVILLVLAGIGGMLTRAVCWVLVDRASGCTDLSEQRNCVHRRHGWQFFGDLGKLVLQDIPFFALLVAYCHRNHYVGTPELIAMVVASIGICYFIIFVLILNISNTRKYVRWAMTNSNRSRGKYSMHAVSPSPIEELNENGVQLKSLSRPRTSTAVPPDNQSQDENYESESDAEHLDRKSPREDEESALAALDNATAQASDVSISVPSWSLELDSSMNALNGTTAAPTASKDARSESGTLERRRGTPALRSTTPIRPARVAPAPTIAHVTNGNPAVWTRTAGTTHSTSGPHSDMTVNCSTSSVSSAGNGRPTSTALTLDQLLNEWDGSRPGVAAAVAGATSNGKVKRYATWSEAPPAHIMAAIEQEMSGHAQLEGTSTFCAAPAPVVQERGPPPEAGDAFRTSRSTDASYAARTASLPTSDKARKRYQRLLMSGTAGPDAERLRQKATNDVLHEGQVYTGSRSGSDRHVRKSTLSMDV